MLMAPDLASEIVRKIEERTQQRLANLSVEVGLDVIVLSGFASSFHVKQLAQHCILDMFPGTRIRNVIEVAGKN